MRPIRRALLATCVVLTSGSLAPAQTKVRNVSPPVVSSVFPPGAKVGTTVAWTLNGRGLNKVKQVLIAGGGVDLLDFEATGENQAVATVRVSEQAETGYRELRVEGPEGVSNLVLVRIDTLPQSIEVEPNDTVASAQPMPPRAAMAGVIRPLDVDHFLVEGPPGQLITIDLEARRVGTSITPVLTALNRRGGSLAQARESRSSHHDCQLAVKIPGDGGVIVQVRDNTYGGSDNASYRVRVSPTPFATGLFPLGGPQGKAVTLTASGGSLKKPITKTITLPDTPGAIVDPGPFEGPDGVLVAPGRVMVGDDRPEIVEAPVVIDGVPTTPISMGQTANGRIERRNEVDRYSMKVKKGDKFRIRIDAEPLGSWLDSVVSVAGSPGADADNDDRQINPNAQRGINALGLTESSADSQLDYEATGDGTITIDVTDRFGDGGPEYGYRLRVGPARPDFAVHLLIGNPNANGQVNRVANNRMGRVTPGLLGVFNLAIGTKTPVNFVVVPEGRPGPVTIRVEGLPPGVTVEPVKVDVLGPGATGGQPTLLNAPVKAENFVLNVQSYADPGLGEIRVVGTAEPAPGVNITRTASAVIGLESVSSAIPARPITRQIDRFPLRLVGEARYKPIGPPETPRLLMVSIPGVLLQGDRIDLRLEFDQSPILEPGFDFIALAKGVGLATNTVIASGQGSSDSEDETSPGDVLVRVLASPKSVPGVYPVSIAYSLGGGSKVSQVVSVIVRPPLEALVRDEPIALKPGGSAKLWVGLRRQKGAEVEVEIKVEGLPRGVKLTEPLTLKENDDEGELTLEMASTAKPLTKATDLRVIAVARMPRGAVSIEARNRPRIVGVPADNLR